MDFFRRVFRRDDTIDLVHDTLDLEETRRLGLRDKRSAHEAIAAIKAEQQRLRHLRKLLEKQSGRLAPNQVRSAVRSGGQFAEMSLAQSTRPSDMQAIYETQLREIETRQKIVNDLWVELELFVRS